VCTRAMWLKKPHRSNASLAPCLLLLARISLVSSSRASRPRGTVLRLPTTPLMLAPALAASRRVPGVLARDGRCLAKACSRFAHRRRVKQVPRQSGLGCPSRRRAGSEPPCPRARSGAPPRLVHRSRAGVHLEPQSVAGCPSRKRAASEPSCLRGRSGTSPRLARRLDHRAH
jgi:hypothetical protein